MKARPILFSAPMVRSILEGRKTQTRRVMKPQPPEWCTKFGFTAFTPAGSISARGNYMNEGPAEKFFRCPYGVVGDRLWVRETWREREPDQDAFTVEYRADRPEYRTREDDPSSTPWRPSIHMPRVASRITLEVTGVRVERLQDISYEDACAEGCKIPDCRRENVGEDETWEQTARRLRWPQRDFESLWSRINGAESWVANPWVWVIEFARISQAARSKAA